MAGAGEPERTEDGRYLIVKGRRWRVQDPQLDEATAARLLSHLGRARSEMRRLRSAEQDPAPARRRVGLAKRGLGERGQPWWEQSDQERVDRAGSALRELDELAPP